MARYGDARNGGGGGDAPCDGVALRACTRCAPRSKIRKVALGSVREGVESRVVAIWQLLDGLQ